MIVDDSPFSINIIKEILEKNNFEVVATATNKDEMIENACGKRPNLVTMDMTLPGTDGLECTKLLHEIDKNIKVIIISSLKDEALVKEANNLKVSGYIQKPVDEDELVTSVKRIIQADEIYQELQNIQFDIFKEAFANGINRMTRTIVDFSENRKNNNTQKSKGISTVIGIIGRFPGRLLIDMSIETAFNLTQAIYNREAKGMDEIINVISELANIIAGNGCSVLNKKNKAFGLRLSPPTVFHGESIHISQTTTHSYTTTISSQFGEITLSVGFSRGEQ